MNQMSYATSEADRKRKNRRLFIGIALSFIIPLAGAWMILAFGWYTPGVTNKGELIQPPIEVSSSENAQLPDTWRLTYRVPATCDEACINGLYVINQTDLALGRDSNRVRPVAIQASEQVQNLPELSPDSRMIYLTLPDLHQQLGELPADSLFIIDPRGFVIMRYDGSSERAVVIQRGREILDDLKKLLKMSRVG